MNWLLQDIAAGLTHGKLVGDGRVRIQRVHTDTRTLQPGDLFVAIAGDKFDANDMLAQAKAHGATAAIAHSRETDGLAGIGLPGIEVPNTRLALGELANLWRQKFQGPLVAVTGSNGKTTVTQMLASIFKAHANDGAHATRNSFNNDIGLPLTLLGLRARHTHAVAEIGMNQVGEIAALAQIAEPTIALVNNAQREHQEFMGSVDAVARENAQVFAHTRAGGIAVFPAADAYTALWRELAQESGLRCYSFGHRGDFSVQVTWANGAQQMRIQTPSGNLETSLHMPGEHNATNALAAAVCAWSAGVPLPAIAQGLRDFTAVTGRSRLVALTQNLKRMVLVDDSYNANPDSVRAAIDVLKSLPAPQRLILGDMGEVGDQGPAFHAEIGEYAAQQGIGQLWGCGELAIHAVAAHRAAGGASSVTFVQPADAITRLSESLGGCASVLVKGSRFMRMERVVQAIESLDRENPEKASHAA